MNHGTLLGFDFGTKRIGVAVGQTLTGNARPLTTLRANNEQPDWEAIGRLIANWQPVQLVVGLPVNMDGSEHDLAATVHEFAEQLRARFALPVDLIDERLSSHEAQHLALTPSLSQRERGRGSKELYRSAVGMGGRSVPHSLAAKEQLDRIAAQVILETWLSHQNDKR